MADNYTLTTTLIANTRAYVDEMNKAKEATKQMDGQAQKSEGSTSKFGKAVGVGMAVAGTAITAVGVKSLKSFGDFEQGLNTAAIIAGGTSKDIAGLSDVALKMGQDLPLSAQDSANAMIEMARNGASVDELKKVFPAIAMASTAAGADLSATAGVVQQAMNVWGKSLESPEQAAALLTQTANLSNASIESMQQALATMGPTAVTAGMSLSDTSTAIGLLTNTGTSSAEAAQQLRHALLQMQAPGKKTSELMQELGLNYRDAQGNMKPFTQIVKEVDQAIGGLAKGEQDAAMKTLFHTSGMQAMRTMMNSMKDTTGDAKTSWSAYSKEMEKVGKNTQTANEYLNQQAYDMQNNVGAKIEQVGGAWDTFSMKSMQGSKGLSTAVLEMTANTIDFAANSNGALGQAARGFMGLSPVIGTAMTATSGFVTQSKNIAGAMKGIASATASGVSAIGRFAGRVVGLNKPLQSSATASEKLGKGTSSAGKSAGTASPKLMGIATAALKIGAGVGIAAGGIAVLVLAISQLAKEGEHGTNAVLAVSAGVAIMSGAIAISAKLMNGAVVGAGALAVVFVSVGVAALGIGTGIGLATSGMALLVGAIALVIPQLIKLTQVADKIPLTLKNIGIGAAQMITSFASNLLDGIPEIIAMIDQMMSGILKTIIKNAPLIGTAFGAILIQLIGVVTVNVPKIVNMFSQMLISILEGLAQNMPKIIKAFTDMMVSILKGLKDNVPKMMKSAVELIVAFLKGIGQNQPKVLKAGVDMIINILKGIGNNVPRLIPAAIEMVGKFLMGIANSMYKLYETGKKVVLKVIEGIGQIMGNMLTSGGQILQAFINGFMKGIGQGKGAGKNATNQVKDGIGSISLWDVGKFLMDGLLGGITSKARELWDKATEIANGIKDKISSALHIGSPSKDMIKIGAWTTEGMAIGLDKEKKLVSRASAEIAELARIEPVQYESNFDTPKGVNMRSANDLNISLNENQVQPASISLSLGGRDFSSFVSDISKETSVQSRLMRGNGVY